MSKFLPALCILATLLVWVYFTRSNMTLLLIGVAALAALIAFLNSRAFGLSLLKKSAKMETQQAGLIRKTVDLDGLVMTYNESKTERGDKPLLVLIHGFTSNKEIWNRCAKHLAADYHLIVPDMAGHGETLYDVDMNYSIPSQAAWLQKLFAHLGVDKAHIAGNSMGGFIAAYFAKYYPEHTQSALLLDPAGITSPEPSDIAALYENTGENLFLATTLDGFKRFIHMTVAKMPPTPKIIYKALAHLHISRRDTHEHIFNDFFDSNQLETDLKHIKAPTLLIWGRLDQILNVSAVPVWEAGISNCKTIIWDDLGHVPMFEAPKRTADAMKEFIEMVKA